MPDTYTSQFSGEEIDSALRAAQIISGASTPAELRKKLEIRGDTIPVSAEDSTLISDAVKYRTNPNLLDNWYFGRPVNQRGQTSYGQTQQYSIDRWMITNDYAYVDVADGYITLRGNDVNGFGGIMEKLESSIKNALLGKTATLSFFAKLYTTCAIAGQPFTPTGDTDNFELYSVTFSGSSADYVLFNAVTAVATGAKIADILAAKLELGSTQTLAHKENGVWVLNEIPDFGEQLRRCRRYRWRFCPAEYVGSAIAFGISVNAARALIYLPEQMRTNPTLNFNKNTGLFLTGVDGDIFGMTLAFTWTSPNSICVEFQKSGAFAPNSVYFVRGDGSSAIDISADL